MCETLKTRPKPVCGHGVMRCCDNDLQCWSIREWIRNAQHPPAQLSPALSRFLFLLERGSKRHTERRSRQRLEMHLGWQCCASPGPFSRPDSHTRRTRTVDATNPSQQKAKQISRISAFQKLMLTGTNGSRSEPRTSDEPQTPPVPQRPKSQEPRGQYADPSPRGFALPLLLTRTKYLYMGFALFYFLAQWGWEAGGWRICPLAAVRGRGGWESLTGSGPELAPRRKETREKTTI
ncbi:hypothetical protein V8C34DRAFT_289617 [Trichoderma compactum]